MHGCGMTTEATQFQPYIFAMWYHTA